MMLTERGPVACVCKSVTGEVLSVRRAPKFILQQQLQEAGERRLVL